MSEGKGTIDIYTITENYMSMLDTVNKLQHISNDTKEVAIGALHYKVTEVASDIPENAPNLKEMKESMEEYKKYAAYTFLKEAANALAAIHNAYAHIWDFIGMPEEERLSVYKKFKELSEELKANAPTGSD